jgi:LacI family transcriptional regulator
VRPPAPSARPAGIKDIARAVGVSIGPVDRALHDKPGVSAATRRRVLDQAAALGYRPNLAARHLKSRTVVRVSVHLPEQIAIFWDSLRDGIREAAAPLAPALAVEFRDSPRLGEGEAATVRRAIDSGADGIILAPGDPVALRPVLARAAARKIPVVCVVTDAPECERLASVSAEPFTVGAVAGELLARFLPGGGEVAFFTGWLGTEEHAEKLGGFQSSLWNVGRGVRLVSVVEARDSARVGYERALAVLDAHPDLRGVHVSTVNSMPVLRAIERRGRAGQITVVTTDLFPALVPRIRSGQVAATIYQRPVSQGRQALQALAGYLLGGARPPVRIKVIPHVVMRSNLDQLLDRVAHLQGSERFSGGGEI